MLKLIIAAFAALNLAACASFQQNETPRQRFVAAASLATAGLQDARDLVAVGVISPDTIEKLAPAARTIETATGQYAATVRPCKVTDQGLQSEPGLDCSRSAANRALNAFGNAFASMALEPDIDPDARAPLAQAAVGAKVLGRRLAFRPGQSYEDAPPEISLQDFDESVALLAEAWEGLVQAAALATEANVD